MAARMALSPKFDFKSSVTPDLTRLCMLFSDCANLLDSEVSIVSCLTTTLNVCQTRGGPSSVKLRANRASSSLPIPLAPSSAETRASFIRLFARRVARYQREREPHVASAWFLPPPPTATLARKSLRNCCLLFQPSIHRIGKYQTSRSRCLR